MRMLGEPLSHSAGAVAGALRLVFTSAISGDHIPLGNLD